MPSQADLDDLSADVLTNAVESGASETWAIFHRITRREEDGFITEVELEPRHNGYQPTLEQHPRIIIDGAKILDSMQRISAGETRMAQNLRTRIQQSLESGDSCQGDLDAETDDCILQLSALGKLTY
ncbi:hypothetical protein [Arthrobacter cryoconiti]|uniref:DUF222 domain-containing protein n=1 Tax=Arthrobacter cryoconiti TaxID=748907 RepID=A0ABV8R7P2_9MICC|nr:hypothetical protein [Arthrobacter cryoconiti]MCC9069333.1 hypothetical protein [Arthrobacter cryoconiti]